MDGIEATRSNGHQPFFPADAVIRKVHGESVVLLGGGRALLMQVAHPKVARGVAEHSSFRDGKRARLLRTLRPTLAIVYGSEEDAQRAAVSVNAVHGRVFGDGYSALDPDLLFWVLATLIDTALLMHSLLLAPLSEDEAERYYDDMLRAGELLGVRRELAPAGLGDFRAYIEGMIPALEIGEEARSIAQDLFSGSGATALAGWALREMTAALLPPALREAYGMRWSPRREVAARLGALTARGTLRLTPAVLRRTPWFLLPSLRPEAAAGKGARRTARV